MIVPEQPTAERMAGIFLGGVSALGGLITNYWDQIKQPSSLDGSLKRLDRGTIAADLRHAQGSSARMRVRTGCVTMLS